MYTVFYEFVTLFYVWSNILSNDVLSGSVWFNLWPAKGQRAKIYSQRYPWIWFESTKNSNVVTSGRVWTSKWSYCRENLICLFINSFKRDYLWHFKDHCKNFLHYVNWFWTLLLAHGSCLDMSALMVWTKWTFIWTLELYKVKSYFW